MTLIFVNEAQCQGCGICVDVCPYDAIQLNEDVAQIDQTRCQECEACLDACPNGAIVEAQDAVEMPPSLPVVQTQTNLARASSSARVQVASSPHHWLGAVMAFVGREIVPRIIEALEERDQRTRAVSKAGMTGRSGAQGGDGRGRRVRWRRQGRR